MRHPFTWLLPLLVAACAAPTPYVAPGATGKPVGEVSTLSAASEAKLFPCNILEVKGVEGASTLELGGVRPEVTLPAGKYRVTLSCTSGYHTFKPQVDVSARAGKSHRLTGYLIDDSITIFNMKMRVKVTELP